ncbi:MAG TPA: hypothetical protein VGS03_10230 [Candidatus Polarisedimenticolia bacterium]|nr:hypothetical protein [Candidatus Polarisedimenticolia bacterium]
MTEAGGRVRDGARIDFARNRGAVLACVALLAIFATLSWTAATRKSPVYDEPLHTVGGWLIRNADDFRVDPDHPSLWLRWSALLNGPDALHPDTRSPHWDRMFSNYWSCYLFSADTLYHPTVAADPDRVVARARLMMLIVAVALGALVACFGWRLAGPVAALAATALFALDPGLIGHASLVKNDIALAFVTLLLAFAVWRLGERITAGRLVLVVLAFAAGFGVKFSALLFLPLLPLLLAARALLPWSWAALASRRDRLIAAAAITVVCIAAAWGSIWATSGFRFLPTPDPSKQLDLDALFERMARNHQDAVRFAATGRLDAAPGAPVSRWEPGLLLRAVRFAEAKRLFPQAWLYGIVYTAEGMQRREGFLAGERTLGGWWYYLPLAFLFKAPLATIAAVVATKGWLAWRLRASGGRAARETGGGGPDPAILWTAACLVLPVAVFGCAALASRVSLGVRHAFVLYPFLFLGAGVAAADLSRRWKRPATVALALLVAGLAVESLPAWPDDIAFFNLPSRPHRLGLLGDSNLDWGQDLPLLAAWQRSHPGGNLYLAYFGQADPAHYGIQARRLPTSSPSEPGTSLPAPGERATLAISATHLQGIYIWDPWLEQFYGAARRQQPKAVLGGTIYLFDVGAGAPGSSR